MHPRIAIIIALLGASAAALAAPKIENVTVRPNPAQFSGGKAPEVEISVSISRSRFDTGNCDARLEFGDGEGRTLDFGVAAKRTVRHVYKKGGSFTVAARGAGASPCEGAQQAPLTVAGAPEPKKAAPEKKKAEEKKKAPAKKAPAKKKADEKKKSDTKKAPAKKDEKKKDEAK
ncbi:MAG: hypothetical protein E6H57_08270 [Betaproteobacteria bacterium]|nr:MAG: hypothetical protein E6H57_08270 [Betaproteobacteria bacterium]